VRGGRRGFRRLDIFKEGKIRRFWHKFPLSTRRPRLLEKRHPYIFKDPARGRMMLQKFYAVSDYDLADPFFIAPHPLAEHRQESALFSR
jgi:hypothetical protein